MSDATHELLEQISGFQAVSRGTIPVKVSPGFTRGQSSHVRGTKQLIFITQVRFTEAWADSRTFPNDDLRMTLAFIP